MAVELGQLTVLTFCPNLQIVLNCQYNLQIDFRLETRAMVADARVQKRGVETRQRLIDRTKALLAKADYQSITLDQISAAAGVAKSSILWHFGSKESLLTEAVFDLFEEIDTKINLEKDKLPGLNQRVSVLIDTVAAYFTQNPEAKGIAISLIFSSRVADEIHERIREQWRHHIEEVSKFLSNGEVSIDRDTSAAIMALLHGCYLQWYLEGCSDDMHERLTTAFQSLEKLFNSEGTC